jgi:DNA modification methylase
MSVRVLTGDCRDVMRAMPAESVDCIVTSPPYWGLRDYGVPGQLGLEPTLGEHIAVMVDVFEAAKRLLKKTGTAWINYGDSYAAQINGRSAHDTKLKGDDDRTFRDKPFGTIGGVLKPKDLCMVPNRLAIALQDAGWWVRSEIIWHKPNPMPESVRDRPTSSHEKIWLLAKSERYFYDAEAIAEEANYPDGPNNVRPLKGIGDGIFPRSTHDNLHLIGPRETRNRRNVWTIPSFPFADAHFATFPPALVEPCILAGCPKGGIVLDPFGGSGTTGLVADRLGRNAILIELNPTYAAMAQSRIVNDLPLFAEVATA